MITYLYWAVVLTVAISLLIMLGKSGQWKAGFIMAISVSLIAWAAYFFHFEQVFVKRFGGVMSLNMPDGHLHLGATWKDDNLWIESYDPENNTCHFREYSKGNMLQGKVTIKNCNPLSTQLENKTTVIEKIVQPKTNNSAAIELKSTEKKNKPITLDDMPDI